MTGSHIVALIGAGAILVGMFELLRRGQLREKYAVLWLLVAIVVAVFGIFPGLLDSLADPIGIADPPNLLLFAGDVVLLLVTVHLSWESSRMEERTRALAEEVAMLRQRIEQE